jgi:cell pole-organizing protein PopZ
VEEHDRLEQDDKGILDTVRRILSEDQVRAADQPRETRHVTTEPTAGPDDILELGPDMMVEAPGTAAEPPQQGDRHLVNDRTEESTRRALGSLRNVMRDQRTVITHRGGPSIEDIIRDEMRPLLREWLDANLPPLVEQLVRREIARIVERDGS